MGGKLVMEALGHDAAAQNDRLWDVNHGLHGHQFPFRRTAEPLVWFTF